MDLLAVVVDRELEVLVDGLALRGLEQALAAAGECGVVPSPFIGDLAEEVDDGLRGGWRGCPEVERELAAKQVEVEVVDP